MCEQRVHRKKTVDPSSAERSCISLNRVSEPRQLGQVSEVLAHVSTSALSGVWILLRWLRSIEGKCVWLEGRLGG